MSVLNRKYSDRMDALNKEVNDQSPGDIKTPNRIKRPISMYEKNLSTKSNTVSGQSPPKSETSTMRHALKRYQSHLTELKEIKPNPPPIDLPPVQVFERPKTPVVTPPEPESLSIESIETVENFPAPEPFPINQVPGYLSDPASTLLMTAALNALTQAQAQVKVQPPNGKSTSRDPMAAALAAASAQIIAATLIRPAPPPPVESPPTPPRAPTPPPPPPVITMNSVSTETDIEERPPSPVMAKELHDRMRRSGMTQVYPPQGYPGGMSGSYSNSSSSYDRGGYGGFSSSHSGGYPQSPYGHSYHQPPYPPHPQHQHQQFHSDRYQQGLRPALPTSNSFELPPSRSLSSSSTNGLRNNQPINKNAKQSPLPAPLKKPQPVPLPPPQIPQTTVRAPSPPLLPSPPVSSLSLPISAGKSTSLEGAGIASVSAGSPLPSARETEAKKEVLTPLLSNNKTEVPPSTPVPAPAVIAPAVIAPAVATSPAPETSQIGINNCSSNSFTHWPDLPAIDTTTITTTTPKQPLPSGPDRVLHRTNGSDYSILKSNMSVSSATSARNSRNLTFSDTVNTPSKTQEDEKEDNFHPGALLSPSYKDFHLKYTNGMQAVQSVKSDSFSPRADLLGAENEHVLATHSLSTTSADISELDDSSRTNLVPSENSSPKNNTLSRKDRTPSSGKNNNNHHEKNNENIPETSPASTSPTRTMMDTLLLQTNFLHHRQEIQAQYKAPEHVYMKQFHSVDPRVFEVEFENNQSVALTPVPSTPTRAQYRNSIMELIVATPNFVQSPRHNSDTIDADLEKAAFNASFMNSTRLQNRQLEKEEDNNSDTGSEYDGSVIESQEEEEETKSDTLSDLDGHSVHTIQTTESSILGIHPAQVNGCMIHKLLGTHSEHNMPVEFGSRKSAKVSTNNDTSAKDNAASASNFTTAISNLNIGNEEKAPLNTSEKDYDYVSVDDDTIHSAPVIETPIRAERSLHSRKASTNAPNVNNTSVMSLPNPSMLQHTSSSRSVHRSFKYDEGMKKHILGRQTTSIKGQNKLHETALEFKQDACLNSIDAKNLKLASVTNRNVLVGWQILILKKGELSLLGLAVITGVRTNLLMQTEYRISSDVSLDCWVRLKRGKGMGGTEFQPLRKVLTTKQCSTKMRVIEYKKTI